MKRIAAFFCTLLLALAASTAALSFTSATATTLLLTAGGKGAPNGGATYTTTFPTVENPLSQGGNWIRGLQEGLKWTDPKVTANGCVASAVPTPNRYDDDIAQLKTTALTATANQFVQTTLYVAPGYTGGGGKHESEHFLRMAVSANSAAGYEFSIGFNSSSPTHYAFITRWNGPEGNFTTLIDPGFGTGSYTNTPTFPADGDVYRSEITGTTLKYYQNGVLILQVTDSSIATGQPGLGFWPVDGATPESMGWKNYTAGNL